MCIPAEGTNSILSVQIAISSGIRMRISVFGWQDTQPSFHDSIHAEWVEHELP